MKSCDNTATYSVGQNDRKVFRDFQALCFGLCYIHEKSTCNSMFDSQNAEFEC